MLKNPIAFAKKMDDFIDAHTPERLDAIEGKLAAILNNLAPVQATLGASAIAHASSPLDEIREKLDAILALLGGPPEPAPAPEGLPVEPIPPATPEGAPEADFGFEADPEPKGKKKKG